ncbi:MAG: HEPN domain-containing protein [Candidatus Sumerlaeota bacterium]|nr:HEPN domain-containing protein [Candidatus Sumerlaeota bacterium]
MTNEGSSPPPDSPRAWLVRAKADLALAEAAVDAPRIQLEDICYHTQQAAEKAAKSVLLLRQGAIPRIHDLERLLDLCAQTGVSVPSQVRAASRLSDYASLTRYPGDYNPVDRTEVQQAMETAQAVIDWAQSIIG